MAARWLSALFITVCVTSILQAQNTYWQQFVHYDMDVTLIPLEHALAGEETIWYKNNSPDTLTQFYLHLYPNAYRNSKTVRAREAKRFHRKLLAKAQDAGFIDIESFKIISSDEAGGVRSVSAFKVDDTILEAELPRPLPPGDSLRIELSFYLKVRKFAGRAGYRGNQYDFAQWYPKVCVYDETGWNAEPFHFNGEFYGEFGTFDVTIHLPPTYIVAATGTVVSGDPGWDTVHVDTALSDAQWQQAWEDMTDRRRKQAADGQMRSVTFHAENVHDFAWSTCPDFLYERGEWDGIPIHVLYRSRVKKQWSKVVVRRGARALAWLSGKFGRYPYPQLTIVHGLLGGGMEYPMLVMNSSQREGLILHEVGHIYFYGILGNNEWKEAWLDEGFTTFQTRWYMESRYGRWGFDRKSWLRRATWLQRHRPGNTSREANRNMALSYILSGYDEPISKPAYSYNEPFGYSMNAYTKGAFFYDMLRYVVGEKTFEKICREYFDRWKFKHVNEARFKQVCETVSGMDLDWFFDEWLHKTVKIDYALGEVKKINKDSLWLTEVQVLRKEKGKMPVEVQLVTEAGDTVTQRWPGLANEGRLTFETRSKPTRVMLDPEDKVLDVRRFNNGPPRVEVLFDYPNLSYSPRQTYLVTWRPSGWFNDV
ncbi:MAG: M1 family peptidase, partial [Calditrichaeota bacterium]